MKLAVLLVTVAGMHKLYRAVLPGLPLLGVGCFYMFIYMMQMRIRQTD
jgi:hypothetical protein